MPIKNRKGEIISEAEVKIFAKMMKESLEDHPKLDPVKVKQPVKDDSAVIHSKSAASHV